MLHVCSAVSKVGPLGFNLAAERTELLVSGAAAEHGNKVVLVVPWKLLG